MNMQKFGTATAAYFGERVRHDLVQIAGLDASDHVLVVTSESSSKRPAVAELIAAMAAVAKVSVFTNVQPNPRAGDIDDCTARHASDGITCVVGIGGGSALDQAKATSMTLELGQSTSEVLARKDPLPVREIKLFLVPTTSGTGAELSYGAILTDEAKGEKLGMRGANLAATAAVVDPELTYGVPLNISMTTGFDVLTHALETWLSHKATEHTKALSKQALQRVFKWLPILAQTPDDQTARRELAYASMIMGANLALSTTCLPHRLQYPIGAATDTAHADGLAAIYPAWLDCEVTPAGQKLAEAAQWIGVAEGNDEHENAKRFCRAVLALMSATNMRVRLVDLGVDEALVDAMPGQVSGTLDTDPCFSGPETLVRIYRNAFTEVNPDFMEGNPT